VVVEEAEPHVREQHALRRRLERRRAHLRAGCGRIVASEHRH
jgi:hypothetical protein